MATDGNYKPVEEVPSIRSDKVDEHICLYFSLQRLY